MLARREIRLPVRPEAGFTRARCRQHPRTERSERANNTLRHHKQHQRQQKTISKGLPLPKALQELRCGEQDRSTHQRTGHCARTAQNDHQQQFNGSGEGEGFIIHKQRKVCEKPSAQAGEARGNCKGQGTNANNIHAQSAGSIFALRCRAHGPAIAAIGDGILHPNRNQQAHEDQVIIVEGLRPRCHQPFAEHCRPRQIGKARGAARKAYPFAQDIHKNQAEGDGDHGQINAPHTHRWKGQDRAHHGGNGNRKNHALSEGKSGTE